MKEKHLPYFNLIEAFKKGQCAICYLVLNALEKFFDSLLYENINDVELRNTLRENDGFCNYHAYKFSSYNDSLAVAIVNSDLLKYKIDNFKNEKFNKKTQKKCLACEYLKQTETIYIELLKNCLKEKDKILIESYLNSDGVCVKHFELIIKNFKNFPEKIFEFQIEKYKNCINLLEKFIDSFNYSTKKTTILTQQEKSIWKRSISLLFGFEGYVI